MRVGVRVVGMCESGGYVWECVRVVGMCESGGYV